MRSSKKTFTKVSVVAKKYASALVSVSGNDLEKYLSELRSFGQVIGQSEDLNNYFNDLSIPLENKLKAIDTSLKAMSAVAAGFVVCLLENKRFGKLDEILNAVQFVLDSKRGVKRGVVQAASPLNENEKQAIKEKVKNFLKTDVELEYETNEELLGGAKIQIAGWTIDDSLKNQLNRLKENLNRSAN